MAAETSKPNFQYVWASGGAIVTPSDVKIQTGWTAEVPPFQWENYLQNRQDEAILHLFQKGISEWDALSNYYFTASGVRSYVQGSDGNIYVAVQDNINQNPTTDATDTYWALAFATPKTKGFSLLASFITATTGNFVVPQNTWKIFYKLWGGGGGGGAGGGVNAGNGGSAGGYCEGWLSVTPGQSIPYVIGAGGIAGAGSGIGGGAGNASSFNTTIIAGGGGLGAGGGAGGGPVGPASGGDFNITGGAGTGPSIIIGGLSYGPPGGLAYGTGNTVVGYGSGVGTPGKTPGGGGCGGSGGSAVNAGGAGGTGSLYIWG